MYRVIQFKDLRLGSVLQEGGFGVVYRGAIASTPFTIDQDETLEEVVVKIPKEEKMAQRHRIAFDQEISILSRFSKHQNFVRVDQETSTLFTWLSLSDFVKRQQRWF